MRDWEGVLKMKEIVFKGSGVAIVTPYDENGINYDALKKLIDFQIENGTDAIIIAGTTGESATMTDEEHQEIIRFTVEYVNQRVPVIAGTGSNDTAYAVTLSKHAEEVGADALLIVTPYYNKGSQKGLIRHYTQIADAVNIPIILYNVPSRTGVSIKPETYLELSKHPRIVATKEASGDTNLMLKTQNLCKDHLHFYSGNDDQITAALGLGSLGVISVLANVVPKHTHDICQNFFDGKIKESIDLQIQLTDLIEAMFCEVNPIPIKTALGLMGFEVGHLRMPLCEMEDQNLEVLKNTLKKYHLIE